MPLQYGKPVFAKPKSGKKVRLEDGSLLPEAGATVTHSSFLHRRRLEGVVVLSEAGAPAQAATASDRSDLPDKSDKSDKKSK